MDNCKIISTESHECGEGHQPPTILVIGDDITPSILERLRHDHPGHEIIVSSDIDAHIDHKKNMDMGMKIGGSMAALATIGAFLTMDGQGSRYIDDVPQLPARDKPLPSKKKGKDHRHTYVNKGGEFICSCGRKSTD